MSRIFGGIVAIVVILLFPTPPARAELTFGAVPDAAGLIQTRSQAKQLAGWLQRQLGQQVQLRIFSSETLLHKWMNRYREVDLALLPRDYVDRQSPVEFSRLVTYEPAPSSKRQGAVLVGRRGLKPQLLQQLRDLLLVMDTDPEGARLLAAMGVGDYSAPGVRVTLTPPRPAPARTAASASRRPAKNENRFARVQMPDKPAVTSRKVVDKSPISDKTAAQTESGKKTRRQPAASTGTADETTSPQTTTDTNSKVAAHPARATANGLAGPKPRSPRTEPIDNRTAGDRSEDTRQAPPQTAAAGQAPPQTAAAGQTPATNRTYLWLILLVLGSGGLIKFLLIYQRRPRKRPAMPAPQMLIQHDWTQLHPATETAAPVPDQPSAEAARRSGEAGKAASDSIAPDRDAAGYPALETTPDERLRSLLRPPVRVPALLSRIDKERLTGTLKVTAPHNEKVLTFSRGQLTSATSQNITNHAQTGFLMNKLGYLLVRQGKITEEQRDRALVLCEGNPNLRLGEALVEMGALKRSELLSSLQDQAKMILHSLIVFPEGEFTFIPGDPQVDPKNNLRLDIGDFLAEAAANENEWQNIREMLPSLDTVLEFTPGGQDKVNSGRLTVHQKFVLSLIDGKRCIRDICVAATMLDYELYRFLYLMVKANILRRVAERDRQTASA
ncbi:uncharacterized protein DUF4388 [Geothermobacter ehrlichii]|uniref:Uncharacterized protein DUF4388 n=1 Tax=Geothermobacter ehrlichii TaxID=213224 RepID=A0A5D3WK72_9BACT|nr:DUF4388 domain-containing protein [Geothermobacter ehrlichii]TYO98754.1 uncharacterized protein DUF4388 [Geothermobacter ehrlichii]